MSQITAADVRAMGIEVMENIPDHAVLKATGEEDRELPPGWPDVIEVFLLNDVWWYALFCIEKPGDSSVKIQVRSRVSQGDRDRLEECISAKSIGIDKMSG